MATLLDTGLLSFLTPLFIFLFIFVLIYAILNKTKLFGENMGALNLIAAVCIAAVSVFAGRVTGLIISIVPWFVFIAIILFLIFMIFMFFGVKEGDVWDMMFGKTWIFVLLLIIILIGLSQTFEKQITPYGQNATVSSSTGNVQGEVVKTITHPRLLAAIFLLVTSGLAIKLIIDKFE